VTDQGGTPPQPPQGPPPGQQPGYGAQPPGQQQYQAPGPQGGGTNGLAVASMILGILWICYIGSVLAIIFGHVALSQIKKSGDTQGGKGMAIAGLVLGYLGIVTFVFSLILGFGTFTFETTGF
jgi:hypothetical protein